MLVATLTGRGSGEVAVASTLLPNQLEHLSIRPRLHIIWWQVNTAVLNIGSMHLLLDLAKPLVDFDFFFTGLVMILVALPALPGEDIRD